MEKESYHNEIDKLMEETNSEAYKEEKKRNIIQKVSAFTPYDSVKAFHEIQPFFYDKNKCYWFWNIKESKYQIVDETDLVNKLEKDLELQGQTFSGKLKADYIECFKRIGRLNIPEEPSKEWIQFKDQIINIETGEQKKVSTDLFFTNPIPQKIGLSESTPTMDKLFKEWVGEEYVKTLYQIIAYCCYRGYPLHRLFCLVGSGSNGKSCFEDLLENFLGDNCSSSDLEPLMENRFESSYALYKKLACMIGETNFNRMKNTNYLKKATGGNTLRFEIKGKSQFSEKTYAKIIISTNSLPITEDKSEGFYRRWLIIDFPNKFSEKKNILATIPKKEYNNLAKKSISILKELLEEREFHNQGNIDDRKKKYEDTSDPLQKFLREECEQNMNCFTFKYEFKERFSAYLLSNGYRIWGDRELSSYMKQKYSDGQKGEHKWWAWIGLKFKESNTSNTSNTSSHQNSLCENQANNSVTSVTSVTQPLEGNYEEIRIDEENDEKQDFLLKNNVKNLEKRHEIEDFIKICFQNKRTWNILRLEEEIKEKGLNIEEVYKHIDYLVVSGDLMQKNKLLIRV